MAVVAVLAALLSQPASAQQVRLLGGADPELDRSIERAIVTGRAVMRDTLIGAADTLRGPVLVLARTIYVEGVVAGDLVGVDANLFLRPSARVLGDVVNAGGGYYPSALATVTGRVIDRPLARYRVEEHPEVWIIVGTALARPRLELDGLYGFREPSYDRVNGLLLEWGARYRSPVLEELGFALRTRAGWASERGEWLGGGEAEIVPGGTRLHVGAERVVLTNEEWIRGALRNSVAYFAKGRDYRDYYQADRLYAGAERTLLAAEASRIEVSARWQLEDATSLRADDPWSVVRTDDEIRPNRPVSAGVIGSAIAGVAAEWAGSSTALEAGADLELASAALGGDHDFVRGRFFGEWAMRALRDHTLEVEWMLMAPLAGGTLPLQRWSFVGGSGTLNTFDVAEFQGDHVAFVESTYAVPLPERFGLPILGAPELQLVHAAGMAWTDDDERDLEQNLGVRLDFGILYARLLVDPTEPGRPDFDAGFAWPFDRRHAWQK